MRNLTTFLLLLILLVLICFAASETRLFIAEDVSANLFFGILGTVIGGGILSTIYFFLHDYVYKIPEIGGCWEFTSYVEYTSYNPFKEMEITYLAMIWLEGNRLLGTAEKIFEITADGGKKEYSPKERVQANISGFLTKHYLKDDHVTIHIEEFGTERKSSSIQELNVVSEKILQGTFKSSAANSEGSVKWKKGTS